ncbi:MAG: hypothetical protein WCD76_06780 [Pyrinomonadaceae bacterium]
MKFSTILKTSLLLMLLTSSSTHSFAQEKAKPSSRKPSQAKVTAQGNEWLEFSLRARARDLAASTADEAPKWDDRQAAVRVLSQAADLLWNDRPDRSRAWLTRAWELANDVTGENADEATRRYRSNSPQASARATVLAVAGRRDKQFADHLLEQLTDEKEQSRHDSRRGIFDDRTARAEQLLNMALATVESNPAVAASLAERSLADGISFQLQSLLLALRGRDEAAANRVLDAALIRLATGFGHPSEGQVIASYLFTPGRIFGAGSGNTMAMAVGTQTPVSQKTPAEADPARTRRFLSIMQQVLLSMPAPSSTANPSQSAQEFVTLAGSLASGFKLYAPELWMPVEQRMAQVIPDLAPARADNRLPSTVREKLQSGRAAGADEKELHKLYVDGLEEAAGEETDAIARKLAYVQAALATTPEELERGREIAAKIDEAELHEQVVSFLVYRAALLALEKGLFDEAIDMAAEVKPVQHAIVLITVAQRMGADRSIKNEMQSVNRKLRALNLLSDAEKLLKRDDLPGEALRVRLGLVAAFAPIDSMRALEAFNGVVAAINKLDSFDPADNSAPRLAGLDGFSAQSLLPVIRSGYGFKDAVRPLALADFESSVIVAAKLNVPAVRGVCMMEIAQAILGSKMDKPPMPSPTPSVKPRS